MANIPLSFAINPYEHVRDLLDGTVRAEGIDFTFLRLPTEEIFYRFVRYREWDVSEMAFGKLIVLASHSRRCSAASGSARFIASGTDHSRSFPISPTRRAP